MINKAPSLTNAGLLGFNKDFKISFNFHSLIIDKSSCSSIILTMVSTSGLISAILPAFSILLKFSSNGILETFNLARAVFNDVNEVVDAFGLGVLLPLVGNESTGVEMVELWLVLLL